MNKLLKEFLSYILTEERVKREVGDTWQTPSKKWSAKRADRTQGGFTSREAAQAWLAGKGKAPGEEPVAAKRPKKEPERIDGRTAPQAAQSSLSKITQTFGKLTSSLSKMTKQFRKDVYSGTAAGIGTKESTQGETSSCASAQDFLSGRKLTVGDHNHDVPSNVTDADIKRERSKLKGKKASEPDATRNAIMLAWIEKEKLRYTSEGNSPPSDKWLKYAYRAGFSTSRAIQERGANMQATTQAIAKGSIPAPTVTGKEGRKECLTLLQGMVENATTAGEKKHYEKALVALEYAEDTDTAAFYVNKAGRVSVILISNKQTGNDPHGNTTASARMRRVRESAKTSDVPDEIANQIEDTIRQAESILSSGGDVTGVGRQHFSNPKVAKKAASILNDMFKRLPADKGRNKDYTQDIIEKAGGKLRGKPYGKAMAAVYCTDNPKSCTNGIPSVDISDEYLANNAGRAFVHAVQTSEDNAPYLRKILMKVGTVASTSDDATKKLFAPITEGSDNMRKAAKDAHEEIVSRLQTIDSQYCGDNPDKCKDEAGNDINGPATQLYVDTFMRDTHWDQYICNSDNCAEQDAISENKLVDINGHKVTPKKFRECLTTLTGFTPNDNSTDSHESQRELWSHLKRKLKISPKEASISVHGVDTTIGKETYRTKGDSASLLTFLGKGMTECVTGGTE